MAGLNKKDLEYFKNLLHDKYREVLASISERKQKGLRVNEPVVEEIDQASRASEQALHLRLLDKDYKLLREIEHALAKFDKGEYGMCEGTGDWIDRKRLDLRPWTRYTIEYKQQLERRKKIVGID